MWIGPFFTWKAAVTRGDVICPRRQVIELFRWLSLLVLDGSCCFDLQNIYPIHPLSRSWSG